MELLMRPSATGMQPAVLLAVALMCSHMQGIAACRDFRSPILTSGGLLAASAGHQVRHLLQLPALPTPAAVSTSSATAAASASSPADATATASSNASGDTLSGEYPSFGECQTAAAALAGAGGSPGGRRLLTGWTRGRSSRTRNLLDMQDYFRGAVTTANASGATFGSPNWQNAFITSCASQASGSAVVTAGRRPSALEPGK